MSVKYNYFLYTNDSFFSIRLQWLMDFLADFLNKIGFTSNADFFKFDHMFNYAIGKSPATVLQFGLIILRITESCADLRDSLELLAFYIFHSANNCFENIKFSSLEIHTISLENVVSYSSVFFRINLVIIT